MTNILNICSDNINAKRHILDSILNLSDKNLLKNYSQKEAAGVIKTLFKYVYDDEVTKKYGFLAFAYLLFPVPVCPNTVVIAVVRSSLWSSVFLVSLVARRLRPCLP